MNVWQERLNAGDVAYVDMQDGENTGHIRCSSPEAAGRVMAVNSRGLTFTLIKGKYS